MIFVTAFLLGLGIYFVVRGYKTGDDSEKGLGMAFLISAVATAMMSALAISVMNSGV